MVAILTALVPLVGAVAATYLVFQLWKRITPWMSWQRLVGYVIAAAVFMPVLLGLSALATLLVSWDLVDTHVFDGSRGPVLWQVREIVFWAGDEDNADLERQRLEIRDIDSGSRMHKIDYVQYWAWPVDFKVLGEGRDFVWLYSADRGLHTRDIYDGHVTHGQAELLAGAELARGGRSFSNDSGTRGLFVETKAGKQFLDPTTLKLVPVSAADTAGANRFTAYHDSRIKLADGRTFAIQNDGTLTRLVEPALAWEPVGTQRFVEGGFLHSASMREELPTTFFIAHQGSLSRVEADGTVRWMRPGILDSSRTNVDYAFTRHGRLCVVQDDRLACFTLDNGEAQWVIR